MAKIIIGVLIVTVVVIAGFMILDPKINLTNTTPVSETIDGTGLGGYTSSIASSIVSYRTGTGPFKTVEQLLEVYGIGNATYRKIRNFVTLHE